MPGNLRALVVYLGRREQTETGEQCHLCHAKRIKLIIFSLFLTKTRIFTCLNFLPNFFHPSVLLGFSIILVSPSYFKSQMRFWLVGWLVFYSFVFTVCIYLVYQHVSPIFFAHCCFLHPLLFWFNLPSWNNFLYLFFQQGSKTNKLLIFICQ